MPTETVTNTPTLNCGCFGLGCDTCCPPRDRRPELGPFPPCSECGYFAASCYCHDDDDSELRAEFGMSWVHGGGRAEDVSAAYLLFNRR